MSPTRSGHAARQCSRSCVPSTTTIERPSKPCFATNAPLVLVHCAWRLAPGSSYLGIRRIRRMWRRRYSFSARAGDKLSARVGIGTCLEYEEFFRPRCGRRPAPPTDGVWREQGRAVPAGERLGKERRRFVLVAAAVLPLWPPRGTAPPRAHGGAQTSAWRARCNDIGRATAQLPVRRGRRRCDRRDRALRRTRCGECRRGRRDRGPRLVNRIGELLGRQDLLDIGAIPGRADDPEVLWPDVSKLSSVVGWRPSRDLDSGLEETIAWWRGKK